MMLPLLLAAVVSAASPDSAPAPAASPKPKKTLSVRIPMPVTKVTPDGELRFNIPYQIPELNWNTQRFWEPYQENRESGKSWLQSDYATMNWFGFITTITRFS